MIHLTEIKYSKTPSFLSTLFYGKMNLKWMVVFIFLACSSTMIGQTNIDSLLLIWRNQAESDSVRLDVLSKIYSGDYLISNPDSAFLFAEIAYNFAASKSLREERKMAKYSMDILKRISEEKKKKEVAFQSAQTTSKYQFFALFFGMAMILLGALFYSKNRSNDSLSERKKLLDKIDLLNQKVVAQSVSSEKKRKELNLDRGKIEKKINTKIGESSWKILTFVFKNPSSSNKEIAEEVGLSLEGVSSSLRRMYAAFEIKASGNKKVLLMMEAVRISIE